MLIERVRCDLELHRLDLLVIERNAPAIKLYESNGFSREGILKDARLYDSEFHNMILMAKIL